MRMGLDGIPLASPKTGISDYTLELSRALAKLDPDDEFELILPVPFPLSKESIRQTGNTNISLVQFSGMCQ